jgi:hypothetical protein
MQGKELINDLKNVFLILCFSGSKKHLRQTLDIKFDDSGFLFGFKDFIAADFGPGREVGQGTGVRGLGLEHLTDADFLYAFTDLDNRHGTSQSLEVHDFVYFYVCAHLNTPFPGMSLMILFA